MTVLDAQDLDAVRELVNIASGNAATALAMLVGQRTMISVPRVTLEPVERIASIIGTPEQPTVVVAMQLLGDVSGYLLYMMPLAPAHALSSMLLGLPEPTSGDFDDAGRSALQETANVIAGAFVGALGTVIDAVVMISVPTLGIEPPDDVLARYRQTAAESRALCIETTITIGATGSPQGAHLVLLPVGGALEALVAALQRSI
jgi:chemotaxis protein CheC